VNELIKAYTNELDLIYDQIEILWAEADKDEYLCFTKDFTDKIDYLYNRKIALRAMINKHKGD
jgi:hypothetical protein